MMIAGLSVGAISLPEAHAEDPVGVSSSANISDSYDPVYKDVYAKAGDRVIVHPTGNVPNKRADDYAKQYDYDMDKIAAHYSNFTYEEQREFFDTLNAVYQIALDENHPTYGIELNNIPEDEYGDWIRGIIEADPFTGITGIKIPENAKDGQSITIKMQVLYSNDNLYDVFTNADGEEIELNLNSVDTATFTVHVGEPVDNNTGGNDSPGETGGNETPGGSDNNTGGNETPGGNDNNTPGNNETPGGNENNTPGGSDNNTGDNETPGGNDNNTGGNDTPGGNETPGGNDNNTPGNNETPGGNENNTPGNNEQPKPEPVKKDAEKYNPGYGDAAVKPSGTGSIGQTKDNLPSGTTFKIADDFKAPEGWTVKVDEKTGAISFTAPENAEEGASITVPVIAVYPDKSEDKIEQTISVVSKDAKDDAVHNPGYSPSKIKPGATVEINQIGDKNLPEGTTFSKSSDSITPAGWEVTVDEKTGKVTVKVPADANIGDSIVIPVTATYPDGSTETINLTASVANETSINGVVESTDTTGEPGNNVNNPSTVPGGGNTTPGDNNTPGGSDSVTPSTTKIPDFSKFPKDDDKVDDSKSDKSDDNKKDRGTGSKVLRNGSDNDADDAGNANGGVKGSFAPVPGPNPSRVNQAPFNPNSGIAPITGPGIGAVLAGGGGAGAAGKGAVVDTGGSIEESIWTKIANLLK